MISYKIGDVELLPDERPIKAWQTQTVTWFIGAGGKLHLTSQRLIWIRGTFNLIPGPRSLTIPLDDIKSCEGHDVGLGHWITLRLRAGALRSFHVRWGISGKAMAADVNAAMSRGLLDD